jgi:hypothetical protein
MIRGAFGRRRADSAHRAAVRAWVVERLGLGEADLVSLAELACAEPGCPPLETVVTIHRADGARSEHRLQRGLAEIARDDIAALLAPPP